MTQKRVTQTELETMKQQTISQNRFEVDHIGLKLQMKSVSPFRVVQEIIANSFDEDTVKNINVSIKFERPYVVIAVEDDGIGFKDIADVFTMYKYSEKRKDTEKRGRFNLGEKQFFSLAEDGYVETGNYRIKFQGSNRITETTSKPFQGTGVYARIDWRHINKKNKFCLILTLFNLRVIPKRCSVREMA